MPSSARPRLTGDQIYTIAIHYLREIRDRLADEGELGLANSTQWAIDDLSVGPWVWLDLRLTMAVGLPLAQARTELVLALRRLSEVSPVDDAQEALLEAHYHLLPLLHAHLQ